MKQLTWKLVLPLTIISLFTFTKWWYVDMANGTKILSGFPLPCMCPGGHSSLSLQIFISEFIVNILTYFAFWFSLIFMINRFLTEIRPYKAITVILLSVSGFMLLPFILFSSNNIYTLKRNFDIEIMETGYKFIWEEQTKPDYYKYHPEKIKE